MKTWERDELDKKELIAESAALLDLRGIGINAQVEQLSQEYDLTLTRTKLINLKRHPRYQEVKKKAIEAEFDAGTLSLKKMAVDLLPEVYKCLKEKLKDGDTRAAALVVNFFMDKEIEDGPKQAQAINITLAADTPKNSV